MSVKGFNINLNLSLYKPFLKNMLRQRSIFISTFILPILIILTTWWITADTIMIVKFAFDSNTTISTDMISIHIITGSLTAMGITASIFTFILVSDNHKLSNRLQLAGYSMISINIGMFLSLILVLSASALICGSITLFLVETKEPLGVIISILSITILFSAIGNLLGWIYPKNNEGTLILLFYSFIDLMYFTNPMGLGVYLQKWTYLLPGFWPTQIALTAGFYGYSDSTRQAVLYIITYVLILLGISIVLKKQIHNIKGTKVL
ncbi:MAG: hypothetical protein OEZ01_13625 [Candidatus Heimdallarchaeota archaeon]|nr:hypothetical protein [Candidatus Heimdallarchaeota archaeon]MDH5647048.1 hypothetical protein [Candidatus Heimdallarchaeota archaeon]